MQERPSVEETQGLKAGELAATLAAACLLLGNIYYAQPILFEMANGLHMAPDDSGLIVAFGQLGYIAGLIFLAPLGDVFENRRLCSLMAFCAGVFALLASMTENAALFLICVFCMGVFATATQILVVFATILSGPERSGRILGIMACGLFLGIALSRPISSFITSFLGWRAVYILSGMALLAICLILFVKLPRRQTSKRRESYFRVIGGMFLIGFNTKSFFRLTALSCCAFMGFTMFWSAAPICIAENGVNGKEMVSLFTLAGLIAPPVMLFIGNMLDKGHARVIKVISLSLIISGWALSLFAPANFWIFLIAALMIDPSSSAVTVTAQKTLLASAPVEKRGRINSLNISCNFLGGAAGAAQGPWLLSVFSWKSVALAGLVIVFALIIFGILHNPKRR